MYYYSQFVTPSFHTIFVQPLLFSRNIFTIPVKHISDDSPYDLFRKKLIWSFHQIKTLGLTPVHTTLPYVILAYVGDANVGIRQ